MGMPVLYVAGPFRAKAVKDSHWEIHENIFEAEKLSMKLWHMGAATICPHANTAHMQNALPDDVYLKGDLAILERCDAVVMMSNWGKSSGAIEERAWAALLGMPIFYEATDMEKIKEFIDAWLRGDGKESGGASNGSKKQSLRESIRGLFQNS